MTEIFWLYDPNILFSKNIPLLPNKDSLFINKLNIYARLIFLVGIVFFVMNPSLKYISLVIIGQSILYMIYRKNKITEHFNSIDNSLRNEMESLHDNINSKYISPSEHNPCMNILLPEYRVQPNRESLFMDKTKKNVYKNVKNKLKSKSCLFKDISDIYGNVASHRSFYTTPITTIPNKQNEFAEWLYGK